jgi:hypothetical protein
MKPWTVYRIRELLIQDPLRKKRVRELLTRMRPLGEGGGEKES